MSINEKDCEAALWISKYLGIELEPWQERVLQLVLADHRESGAEIRKCGQTHWDSPARGTLVCALPAHPADVSHESADGRKWFINGSVSPIEISEDPYKGPPAGRDRFA